MSCQGCAGAVNRILGKMEGIFIPASYLYYQIQNENDLVIVAIFNSNILTPTINYGCHLHSFGTSITDIALHSSGIKSEKDISGLCAMSRCFPFPPPGYTNKGYEKKATTEDVELLTKVNIEELDDGECSRDEEEKCQRQIVSIDAKRALVGAGAWILFYPTLLYNVLRNQIEVEFRWWDHIDEFLLLGTVPFPKDVPHLKKVGVGGVITLNEPYETLVQLYQAHGIDHLVIPTRDYLYAPSFMDINRAVHTYVEYKFMTPAAALEYNTLGDRINDYAKAVLHEVIRLAPKLHESYHTLGLVYTSL
ncbi:putative dual specificity protein phosphatase DSP8 [Glycine soja]